MGQGSDPVPGLTPYRGGGRTPLECAWGQTRHRVRPLPNHRTSPMNPSSQIQAFFDEPTNTVSYLVSDPATKLAAVIDPVLDYDHRSGKASTASADTMLRAATDGGLQVVWVLETHAHADHLSAAP